jgi:hypothetical protein
MMVLILDEKFMAKEQRPDIILISGLKKMDIRL